MNVLQAILVFSVGLTILGTMRYLYTNYADRLWFLTPWRDMALIDRLAICAICQAGVVIPAVKIVEKVFWQP